MAVNIGPKIQVDGEKEYRAAMAGIIQQSKVLDSELKLLGASFGKNSTAQEKTKRLRKCWVVNYKTRRKQLNN